MNRWNTKGSAHAKIRMGELRADKAKKAVKVLRWEYCERHGIDPFDSAAFTAAKAAAGLPEYGGGNSPEYLAFLKG